VSIVFPLSTHVRLQAEGYELGLSRPIPDWVASATLFATPRSVVSVRVRAGKDTELPASIAACQIPTFVPGDADGAPVSFTLTKVRDVGDGEALYTTPAIAGRSQVHAMLTIGGSDAESRIFEFDLSGGASETIDLARAENLHPEFPATATVTVVKGKRGVEFRRIESSGGAQSK
jgi:hypothetical protein